MYYTYIRVDLIFDFTASDLVGRIFSHLKTRHGLMPRHFQLVVTDHLNRIDLSSPYQHEGGDLYIDAALEIIRVRQPVTEKANGGLRNIAYFGLFPARRTCSASICPTCSGSPISSGQLFYRH